MANLAEYKLEDRTETFKYLFSDVVMVCVRPRERPQTVWYIECTTCHQKTRFKKFGKNYWKAHCKRCNLEFVITPSELHTTQFINFREIIGDVTI